MTSTRTWRGLTLGGDTYHITRETGLDDLEVRSGMRELPRTSGATPGLHFAHPRTIALDLWWAASTAAAAEALTEALRAVTGPSEETLHEYGIQRADGSSWFTRARVIRRTLPRSLDSETIGLITGQLVLECPDPRLYSTEVAGVMVDEFGAGGGGFDLDTDIPIDMTAAAVTLGVAVNQGTAPAYPTIRFAYPAGETGDADGFTLTNLTTGAAIEVVTTLVAGQTLTIDLDALIRATGDQVCHIGGSSRYGSWTPPRDPLTLIPGTNLLRFDLDGDAPITCRVDWRHTDL